MNKKISVLIPVRNEEKYIESCLDSIVASDYSKDFLEVLIIDGLSNDNTRNIISEYIKKYSFIHLIDNPDKIVPKAMNIGISEAKGEYIIRLDAHSIYPINYFSTLVENSIKLEADNVGAVAITDVKNKNKKSNAIKMVLSHKFGVGNSDFRTGIDTIKEVDTVPFGCFKKDVFKKYGLYNEKLIRNQDIELNKRIKQNGGKIYLLPNLKFIYFARETFNKLWKNNYQNGLWNILTAYYTNSFKSLSLRHFIPLIYILSLAIPLLCSIIDVRFVLVSFLSFMLHTGLIVYFSINSKSNDTSIFYIVISFLTLHYSYGLGSLIGLVKVIKLKYMDKQ